MNFSLPATREPSRGQNPAEAASSKMRLWATLLNQVSEKTVSGPGFFSMRPRADNSSRWDRLARMSRSKSFLFVARLRAMSESKSRVGSWPVRLNRATDESTN